MADGTYRERREAKAERLREWAEKRETRAAAVFAAGEPTRSDWTFITQPGHIPARARMIARDDRAHESVRKAQSMASRANGIEAQLASSIYSDDPDAIERLREKLARLEAERDRIKAYNASCRNGAPDLSLLNEDQRQGLATHEKFMGAYQERRKHQMPSYALSNLNGTIKQTGDRIADLEAQAQPGDLIGCTGCGIHGFRYVPERKHPRLCMDCADLAEAGL